MGYRRYADEVIETRKSLVFSLVVKREDNSVTLGGGYVTIRKPITDAQLERALEDGVQAIVRMGNKALRRDKKQIRDEALAEQLEDTGLANILRELVRAKNQADWPPLKGR